jgi:hypothetical protein
MRCYLDESIEVKFIRTQVFQFDENSRKINACEYDKNKLI